MGKRQKYTEEFKREVLEMASNLDVSIAQLERDLGITTGLIYKWRECCRVDENSGDLKSREERNAEVELRRLKRELDITRQERDILKKLFRCFHGTKSYEICVL